MARPPDLERRVLDALWEGGELSVREVNDALGDARAHTTIATVLARLHAKGRVERSRHGLAWRYRPARSREAALGAEVGRMLQRVGSAPEPLLLAILDQVEQVDPAALDRLEALIRKRRES